MDFKTRAASREKLRQLANVFDILCNTEDLLYKPVVYLLDKIQEFIPFVHYSIVENNVLPRNVFGRGYFYNDNNDYMIEIPDFVYEGAINGIGAYRGFIMHEIFHAFLLMVGYTPILKRSFNDFELHPFESIEWQVKCITGEYMVNYELTKGMNVSEIVECCGVSKGFAKSRTKLDQEVYTCKINQGKK